MKLCSANITSKSMRSGGFLYEIFGFDRSSKLRLHMNLYGSESHLMCVMSAIVDELGMWTIEMLIDTCQTPSHTYTHSDSHRIRNSMLTIEMLCADLWPLTTHAGLCEQSN